jgi:hypothetical protein
MDLKKKIFLGKKDQSWRTSITLLQAYFFFLSRNTGQCLYEFLVFTNGGGGNAMGKQ